MWRAHGSAPSPMSRAIPGQKTLASTVVCRCFRMVITQNLVRRRRDRRNNALLGNSAHDSVPRCAPSLSAIEPFKWSNDRTSNRLRRISRDAIA